MLSVSCPAEIAHTLFVDIVRFTRRPMDAQRAALTELQRALNESETYCAASTGDRLVRIPTGDGFVLVFFGDHLLPVRCALEVARALKENPELPVRMGIHSGPCDFIQDINANENVYGSGINDAQRVMSCGEAGHILMSHAAADLWRQRGGCDEWLHHLGEFRLKHDRTATLYSVHSDEIGNPTRPRQSALWRLRNWYIHTPLAFLVIYLLLSLVIWRVAYAKGRMDGGIKRTTQQWSPYDSPTLSPK
jgi:class 3 adenylate cyclase